MATSWGGAPEALENTGRADRLGTLPSTRSARLGRHRIDSHRSVRKNKDAGQMRVGCVAHGAGNQTPGVIQPDLTWTPLQLQVGPGWYVPVAPAPAVGAAYTGTQMHIVVLTEYHEFGMQDQMMKMIGSGRGAKR